MAKADAPKRGIASLEETMTNTAITITADTAVAAPLPIKNGLKTPLRSLRNKLTSRTVPCAHISRSTTLGRGILTHQSVSRLEC